MKTDFCASGNHFLSFRQQTAVNCYQWKQFFIELEHIGNVETRFLSVFCLFFYSEFFSVSGNYYWNQGEVNFLKTNHVPASGHQFFRFFRDFLKWKQLFRIEETYFSISFTWLVQTDFLPSGNSIFWSVLFFCQWKPLLELGGKQFSKKELILASELIFGLVDIIFFSIFQRLLPVIVYFPSSGRVFFNETLHSYQWKRIFWLLETVFFYTEAFLQEETVT